MGATSVTWTWDAQKNIEIARKELPLKPDFSSTVDSVIGQKLSQYMESRAPPRKKKKKKKKKNKKKETAGLARPTSNRAQGLNDPFQASPLHCDIYIYIYPPPGPQSDGCV